MSPNYRGASIAVGSIMAFIIFLFILGNLAPPQKSGYTHKQTEMYAMY
jgi:hypothetical protein